MRYLPAALLPFLLLACGKAAPGNNVASGPDPSDGLQAGRWALTATLGTPQGMGPGAEPPLTGQHCISAEQAGMPARDVILAMTSREACGTDDARFERGAIGGSLRCRGMDDIPEHQQQISGSYGRTSFRMIIDMPVHGMVVRQTIEARRTGAC